jgi:hypothetical protein
MDIRGYVDVDVDVDVGGLDMPIIQSNPIHSEPYYFEGCGGITDRKVLSSIKSFNGICDSNFFCLTGRHFCRFG